MPRDLGKPERMAELQQALLRRGQFIPGIRAELPGDLALLARASASSTLALNSLPASDESIALTTDRAMLLPLGPGKLPVFTVCVTAADQTNLVVEFWIAQRKDNYTPDRLLATRNLALTPSTSFQSLMIDFDVALEKPRYGFLIFRRNDAVRIAISNRLVTGLMVLSRGVNTAVAKSSSQQPPPGTGIESFDFWLPQRRPGGGQNLALGITPPLRAFEPSNVQNGFHRPYGGANAWVADPNDRMPRLTLTWDQPVEIRTIVLRFDTDFDHAMESVLMGHGERAMPFCVQSYRIYDEHGRHLHTCADNHQTVNEIVLQESVLTKQLHIEVLKTHGAPTAIFGVHCFREAEA